MKIENGRGFRCVIIELETDVYKTPEKSKPYIGEHGWARLLDDGLFVEITLDSGVVINGEECWWMVEEEYMKLFTKEREE